MTRPIEPSEPLTSPTPVRAKALRCNATGVPIQRQPSFAKTDWGALRAARGWSLRDLERESGINAGVLSRIERGIGPFKPDHAVRLVRTYGLMEDQG